ncbi:protein jagged-1-like isoform X1 [Biomphalaria glabrata]|uniref:Cysteine-rich venom protein pseudechetoxin-like n=1 Tax=Biomphalaria glabrata TaxID=6526 RepID=A0A9W3A6X9_BIOGL|nr:cysteine-rich venom protein pseudechetoxin-like [Biomphalaria glabrata]
MLRLLDNAGLYQLHTWTIAQLYNIGDRERERSITKRAMTTLLLTKTVLAMLAITIQATSNWNQEARDYILEIHNDKRRGERGCLMNKLIYDMELERQAKQWAEGCVFKHETKEGRGENLAYQSYQNPEKEMILYSSGRWFNEKNDYSYGQHSCGASCHYTQMVWGSTSKVGCYSYRCSSLIGATLNAWYFVCFYTPKGNTKGQVPYVNEKTCKSKCREGQTEDKGLCVGEAKGESVNQGGEDGDCNDNESWCATWAKNSQCNLNPDYMLKKCKKSCNVCGNKTSCKGCVGEAKGGSVNQVGDDKDCNDDKSECVGWAGRGECQANPNYMHKSCRKSCKICGSDTSCVDSISRCSNWAKANECKTNPDWMGKNCRYSCKQCNSDNRCIDLKSNCDQLAKGNECDSNPSYMSQNCQKSCKMC